MIVFNKSVVTDGDIQLNYHLVTKIEFSPDLDAIGIYISSWPTEASRKSNANPVSYAFERVLIDSLQNSKSVIADLINSLSSAGYLQGGTAVQEISDTLAVAKSQKWTYIKSKKYLKEYGGFTWNGFVFDSDEVSQLKILTSTIAAQTSIMQNTPFSVVWTLKDNTVQTFSAQDMVAVSQALTAHIFNVHETASILRQQIDSATTVQEVQSIMWPN